MINITKDMFVEVMNDALQGKRENLEMRLRIIIRKLKKDSPELASELSDALMRNVDSLSVVRGMPVNRQPAPVDADTRQKLLVETYPVHLSVDPLWPEHIVTSLTRFVSEWEKRKKLLDNGLLPSRSLLMDGPPGVGKTLAAKWLAEKLNLPLLTLDLASVMSSFLGKTGNNIRAVLDYARSFPCILLLDEFDSIAKKRDDASDVGELKRLVTVLLQAIDEWPHTSILVAATNHGDLLDPAVWRRFDRVVGFDYPSEDLIRKFLIKNDIPQGVAGNISDRLVGRSFAVIERSINQAKRNSILEGIPVNKAMIEELFEGESLEKLVKVMHEKGMSQRLISSELSLSRPLVKKLIEIGGAENEK
ncbi:MULTISPECIES: AAA family ATPase [unclassified Serratia (in: enterobacteria)]|uniref:AAA family ATPase n=1 Tax=unclassified Serratia (in: enterobacteria) TaxID=2647522 RepID=UPI000501F717|nr:MULTISPECIES: ATP-binding protein [unclassified Serratia (in: enterobacteria)]KFK93355.1 ATPase [Serratia sp. Ag2]KFK98356.1 ATPase [Serratia sp. Ag1]